MPTDLSSFISFNTFLTQYTGRNAKNSMSLLPRKGAKEKKPPLSNIETLTKYTGTNCPKLLRGRDNRLKKLRILLDVNAKYDAIRQVSEKGADLKGTTRSSEHTKKSEQAMKQRIEDDAAIVVSAMPALLEALDITSVATVPYTGGNNVIRYPSIKQFISLFRMGGLCKELNG